MQARRAWSGYHAAAESGTLAPAPGAARQMLSGAEVASVASVASAAEQTILDAQAAVAASLAHLALAETHLGAVSATIGRSDGMGSGDRRIEPDGPAPRPALPSISLDLAASDDGAMVADLVARGELGRGGMGVVLRAEQRSLERDVAVKTTQIADARAARALVREGRLMGGLEHPSVVPVHALGMGSAGTPLLVMKRVEGVTWRTLLRDEGHEGWKPLLGGHQDRLRAHVEILAQVCRALAFAHDRGVVHRDVKPENVMIGRFGEVYLLDWGVALRLRDRDAEPEALVGTPGYIAPEMIGGDPHEVEPRTDVYLLGGTLYEVLSGRMPHEAPTALAAFVSSMTGATKELPASAPRELCALVGQAMARRKEDRVASAEAFREALARFLASHEADRVAADGRAAVARADVLAEERGHDSPEVFRALVEARFAFVAALRIRQGDAATQAALESCLGRLVERELALRSPGGARAALLEMREPPPAMEARVAALERTVRAERDAEAQLESARRDADASIALRAMLATIGVFLVIGLAVVVTKEQGGDPLSVAERWLLVLGLSGVAAWLGRKTLLATAMARRLAGLFTALFVTGAISAVASSALGEPHAEAAVHSFLACAGVTAAGALALLPELWLSVAVLLGGCVAAYAAPTQMQAIQIVVVGLDVAAVAWALWRHSLRARAERLAHRSVRASVRPPGQ